jgi:hypothetical protein
VTHASTPAQNSSARRGFLARWPQGRLPLLSGLLVSLAVALAASLASPPAKASACTVSSKLVPSCGVWWGATAGAGNDRAVSLSNFEKVSTRTDIYHSYHRLGQKFPTSQEISMAHARGHKRLLLLDFLPEGGHSWAQVARGASDSGIDAEARYIKSHFTDKFFMSIHHEPEEEVRPAAGSGHTAADFRAMFRHVVQRFRNDGVRNVVFVVDYMGTQSYSLKPWFKDLYPGDDVVDWIAEDPYGCVSAKVCDSFANTVNRRFSPHSPWPGFYKWATTNHPSKPIMLAEWGVFGNQGSAAKTKFIKTVPRTIGQFPKLKAIVYFNSDSPRGDTLIHPGTTAAAAMKQVGSMGVFSQTVP